MAYRQESISYTINSLKRWSCGEKSLPPVETIRDIHVYDFDNTLFKSPLPNRAIWNDKCIGRLQNSDVLVNGGWWHDANLLKATGEGVEVEEPRAWEGWWNEKIVKLVRMSMQQDDVVTVLLTGRAEGEFQELIKRMIKSKGLVFDMICLKPYAGPNSESFSSTMEFKQILLASLIRTYAYATGFKIYEDRERHVTQFQTWIEDFNDQIASARTREMIRGEVIPVVEQESTLEPLVEMRTIQFMINSHNQAILAGIAAPKFRPLHLQKSVLYTAYHISASTDQKKLLTLLPSTVNDKVKKLASSIVISPKSAHHSALAKIGGLGTKTSFHVTEIGSYENRIWATRCEPTNPSQQVWHVNGPHRPPLVVLAIKPGTQPYEARNINKWQKVPEDKTFTFQTIVKEIFRLNIEDEVDPNLTRSAQTQSQNNENVPPQRANNRDYPPLPSATKNNGPPTGPQSSHRNQRLTHHRPDSNRRDHHHNNSNQRGSRRGGSSYAPRGRGGSNRSGAGGGQGGYRDYDAQGSKENGSGMFDAY